MPLKLLTYLRGHAIATLALICSLLALAGSSYAALTIPGSQIRNRSINAVKLNPRSIAASVQAWVIVQAETNHAQAVAASSRVRVSAIGTGESITWPHRRFGQNCMASVTPQVTVSRGPFGSVTAAFNPSAGNLTLYGFGPNQIGAPQAAYVMIVCP